MCYGGNSTQSFSLQMLSRNSMTKQRCAELAKPTRVSWSWLLSKVDLWPGGPSFEYNIYQQYFYPHDPESHPSSPVGLGEPQPGVVGRELLGHGLREAWYCEVSIR